jgi:Leucine-rich repeat (LRR) protein
MAVNRIPSSLRNLDLDSNELEEIASIIISCPSITSVALSNNKISHLPSCFGVWNAVTVLKLRSNKLRSLPGRALPVRYLRGLDTWRSEREGKGRRRASRKEELI